MSIYLNDGKFHCEKCNSKLQNLEFENPETDAFHLQDAILISQNVVGQCPDCNSIYEFEYFKKIDESGEEWIHVDCISYRCCECGNNIGWNEEPNEEGLCQDCYGNLFCSECGEQHMDGDAYHGLCADCFEEQEKKEEEEED